MSKRFSITGETKKTFFDLTPTEWYIYCLIESVDYSLSIEYICFVTKMSRSTVYRAMKKIKKYISPKISLLSKKEEILLSI